MKAYQVFSSERSCHTDRATGAKVHRLTDFKGNSVHPYFTDDGWYANDTKMLFLSDRGNARNIFSLDFESGEISRLTDTPAGGPDLTSPMDVNKRLNEMYYTYKGCVYALNLDTLDARPLYIIPKGYNFGGARPTADGKYFVGGLSQDLSASINANLRASYIGFREIFEAKPDCRVVRVNVETGDVDEVWRERCWVGHVNPSTQLGGVITFWHEGPWHLVDHRIWMLDMDTGKTVKIRQRRTPGEMIGHEYWFADGVHVGYQVHSTEDKSARESWFGFSKYDGTGEIEAECKEPSMPSPDHIHSNGFDYVVSDSGKTIKGYRYNGKSFDGPRVICMHDGDFFWGAHHPHPRLTRDGKRVVFNSTCAGYCNIYMAEIPEDFDSLPPVV